MMLTGVPIDAQEAWRIELVNRVVEPAGLELEAANYAAISTSPEFRQRLQAFLDRRRT